MDFAKTLRDFVANPFDPNNDGKTSVPELFAALGLLAVFAFAWKKILNLILEA